MKTSTVVLGNGTLLILLLASGCVSKKAYLRHGDEEYKKGWKNARTAAKMASLERDLADCQKELANETSFGEALPSTLRKEEESEDTLIPPVEVPSPGMRKIHAGEFIFTPTYEDKHKMTSPTGLKKK